MTALIIGLFIVAALASVPIAHALVLASVGGLLIIDRVPVHLAVEQMLTQTQSFPLIAIPFFMMTGALMVSGRLGQSLVNLLTMMIGRVHGGPAQVGVLSSTIFGGSLSLCSGRPAANSRRLPSSSSTWITWNSPSDGLTPGRTLTTLPCFQSRAGKISFWLVV